MSTPAGATPAEVRLTAYLTAIAARMRGPGRRRAAILDELRDGLEQAVCDQTAAGLPADEAAAIAIERFGSPAAVAGAFAAELTTAYARRTLAWFIATGPLVGIWWLLLLQPWPWRSGPAGLLAAVPVIPLVMAAVAAAAVTFATTGRLIRWLPETGPRGALTATVAVAALATIGDTLLIGQWAASAAAAHPLTVAAIAASATRIGCSIMTMRHATTLRPRSA